SGGERLEVGIPQFLSPLAQLVEVRPGINTGIVKVVEYDAHRVVADRLQVDDSDLSPTRDQLLLAGTMALDFGRRALHAEEFRRKAKRHAIVEVNLENFLCLPQTNFRWPMTRAEMRRLLGHA